MFFYGIIGGWKFTERLCQFLSRGCEVIAVRSGHDFDPSLKPAAIIACDKPGDQREHDREKNE